ncbi:glycoside hydrolase family 43 protein [Pseudochryseolinea flava]|uniref:Glycoside hydrolase n=1 Tax=Pseudochryseolinea flava TaxID=2059302 RepID=A0A364Y372_9BACT|nr:glycoside hydrolase family 43 protein [Pseudochryseolinea flava]RAW00762.1 glycoside hydrolase [Pseudochryseolinea flava]
MNGNPIIRHKFTSDPTVLVHNDRVYVYTGHDEAPLRYPGYVLTEWLCFSSDDLQTWDEHPIDFSPSNFSWAARDAFASKIIHRDGKFYFYVSLTNRSGGEAIGVAVADNPTGPFIDARGTPLVTTSHLVYGGRNFDPSVIIDDDGQAFLFWGKDVCYYAPLKTNMIEMAGAVQTIALPKFQEGVHLHKREEWFYLCYGYDMPEKVAYAMSRHIHGPWEFKGILNEVPVNCETNRPAIVDFKGVPYFFYHNGALANGGSYRRSLCVDRLYYNADGTMKKVLMTTRDTDVALGIQILTKE